MTQTKTFASQYLRNEQGWIKLPRDIEYRRSLFGNGVFQHPAKMQLRLCEALVEYLTEPGDWILDPFGGAGTTAIAARTGRHVILVEIEDYYCDLIKESASILVPGGMAFQPNPNAAWTWMPPSNEFGVISLYKGDNRVVLPSLVGQQSVSCIITSPPYALSVNRGGHELESGGQKGVMQKYAGSPLNLSQLNSFYWERAMEKVWRQCADMLQPGGTMAFTCRDTIAAGRRDMLSAALIRQAERVGLKFRDWFKWELPRTLRQTTNLAQGGGAVTDEDIIVLVKS